METKTTTSLKAGDVLLCKGKSKLSKIINIATGSEWSHTAQVIEIEGVLFVIDAQKEGIVPRNLELWKREFDYQFKIFRSDRTDPKAFTKSAVWYSGLNYDFKHLGLGLFKSIVRAKEIDDKFRGNGKFICSEYTALLLGIQNPEDFSPGHVFQWLKMNPYFYETKLVKDEK